MILQINACIIPMCSTAVYAAMLTKSWRIYKIFDTTPKLKKVVIKDMRLVVYILMMVSVDAFISLLWYFFDSIKLRPRFIYETQSQFSQIIVPASYLTRLSNQTGITVQNDSYSSQLKLVYECTSNYNEVWITILIMYKISLSMYGIYLAWITRNINVPAMNDSKYLLLSTYTIIICGLGSMTLVQLLKDWPDVVQVFFSIGLISATAITQCLVFVPKVFIFMKL
jgi:gamma-aminobutyric acid type B receptor